MRSFSLARSLLSVALSFASLAPRAALAETSDGDRAAALFDEGVALAAAADFDAACPKFAESQQLDPSLGTQYNLALCFERQGKLGSAWRNFRGVEQLARATGNGDRERAARQKLDALRPRVRYLALSVSDADAAIAVDGEQVQRGAFGFYPVDAGAHTVLATAPGKESWETRIEVPVEPPGAAEGEISVAVPPLAIARGETRIVTRETSNPKRTLALVTSGVGVAAIGAGVVTGIMILDSHATAKERCTPTCNDATGRDAVARGKALIPVNAVALGIGVAGLAVGSFLFFTSSPKKATGAGLAPIVGDGVGGASVIGRF